jgi:cytoskeletal protein CcmA (bactofilin family)
MSESSDSKTQNGHSMIGKSIVIKGEISASDPVYIYGCVEGTIHAPAQRVTIGKEGKAKADISAREVVIMGDVCGNLDAGYRVEIRSNGSLTGDLAAPRVCIEEGASLKGVIDVRQSSEEDNSEVQAALEQEDAAAAEEEDLADRNWADRNWANYAVSKAG